MLASDNDLPMTETTLRQWARLKHRQSGTLMEDAMISATAFVHRLTVVTGDVREFRHLGVELPNLFGSDSEVRR